MINGDKQKFVDTLRLGEEVLFEYRQHKFYAEGYNFSKNEAVFQIDRWTPERHKTVYKRYDTSVLKCVDHFLEEAFFDGGSYCGCYFRRIRRA